MAAAHQRCRPLHPSNIWAFDALETCSRQEVLYTEIPTSRPLPPKQYGSPKFLEQHDWIVQLNLQAHHNAMAHADEFVMEALVSHGKIDVLVHSLLVAEVRASKPRGGCWASARGAHRCQACAVVFVLLLRLGCTVHVAQLRHARCPLALIMALQVWRERVCPLQRQHLATRVDSVISWSLVFHETALANLLEVKGRPRMH